MGANHRLLHPHCACGDCIHLRFPDDDPSAQEGFCEPAREALLLEGYARAVVLIEPDMSAETCPSFEDRRPQYGPDEAACDTYHAKRDAKLCGDLPEVAA